MVKALYLVSVLALTSLPLAWAQQLEATANLAPYYRPGDEIEIALTFRLVSEEVVPVAVAFLNVVERDTARGYPQMAHRIFRSAESQNQVFQLAKPGEVWQRGVETALRARLRDDAPPGEYALVVQLFRGSNTNPHRVRSEDRLGIRAFNFSVIPR
jgi:hypothetical protein